MKTIDRYPIILLFSAAAMCCACNKEAGELNVSDDLEFIAAHMEHAECKTLMGDRTEDGQYPLLWSRGDRIVIFSSSSVPASSYFVTDDEGAGSARFVYDKSVSGNTRPKKADEWQAFYPASGYSFAAGKHVLSLESTQEYSESGFGSGAMPMAASSTTKELSFKNLCGICRLRISSLKKDAYVNEIKLKADKNLYGSLSCTSASGTWTMEEDGGNVLTLNCGSGVKLSSEPRDFCIVLPPESIVELKIQLSLVSDGTDAGKKIYSLPGSIDIERSGILNIDLDLAQFRSSGIDDIIRENDVSAITGLEYRFETDRSRVESFRDGGNGKINITSLSSSTFIDGSGKDRNVSWKMDFSIDKGATWNAETPEMFDSFVLSGDGNSVEYNIPEFDTDRECLVRFTQEESGKTQTVRVIQLSNAIIAEYLVADPSQEVPICTSHLDNLKGILYDDGTEISFEYNKYLSPYKSFYHRFQTEGKHKAILWLNHDAKTLDRLMQDTRYMETHKYLIGIDLSHLNPLPFTSMDCTFDNCWKLAYVIFPEKKLNTVNLVNIHKMFYDCSSLIHLDINKLETSAVKDMSYLFGWDTNLTTIALDGFRTDSAENMESMFSFCRNLEALDVTGFDTRNVKDMNNMFGGCETITSLDVSGFKTDNVTSMGAMFNGCKQLRSLDVSNFSTEKVTNLSYMFSDCKELTQLDLRNFNTDASLYFSGMFNDCIKLESLDISSFRTDKATTMSYMFYNCKKLNSLDISRFRTPLVKSMDFMFARCGAEVLDLSGFDFSNLENGREMFHNCFNVRELAIENMISPKLKSCYYMFANCDALKSLTIRKFKCGPDCMLHSMFERCYSLESFVSEDFDASGTKDISYLFLECSKLKTLDLSGFHTESATDMQMMFQGCTSLESIDVSSFCTTNVEKIYSMFCNTRVMDLDLSSFDFSKVTDMTFMFASCMNLKTLRMDMTGIQDGISMSRLFSSVPAGLTLYAKDNVVPANIQSQLPSYTNIISY